MKQTQSGFALIEGLLILIIIAIIGGTGWFVWNIQSQTNTSLNSAVDTSNHSSAHSNSFILPKNWTWYKNNTYGFRFAYPASWGSPSFNEHKGVTGVEYSVYFGTAPIDAGDQPSYNVTLTLDTDDFTMTACKDDGQCLTGGNGSGVDFIKQKLKNIQDGKNQTSGDPGSFFPIVFHDSVSYSDILTNPGAGSTDEMGAYRIVLLPKMKISAASLNYELLNATGDCSMNQLSPESTDNCLKKSTLDTLLDVLKSIHAS